MFSAYPDLTLEVNASLEVKINLSLVTWSGEYEVYFN